jgi:hypothetical protein
MSDQNANGRRRVEDEHLFRGSSSAGARGNDTEERAGTSAWRSNP